MKKDIEDKVLEILFKGEVISKTMARTLLPDLIVTKEMKEDFNPSSLINLCRDIVQSNIQSLLEDK